MLLIDIFTFSEYPCFYMFMKNKSLIYVVDDKTNKYLSFDINKVQSHPKLYKRVINVLKVIKNTSVIIKDPEFKPLFRVMQFGERLNVNKVVFVGGLLDDDKTWRHQLKLFGSSFCCIVLYQPNYVKYFGEWSVDEYKSNFEGTLNNILKQDDNIITISHDFGCYWMSEYNKKYPYMVTKNIQVQFGDMGRKTNLMKRLWGYCSDIYKNRELGKYIDKIKKIDYENIHSNIGWRLSVENCTWRMFNLFHELYDLKPCDPISKTLLIVGNQMEIMYYSKEYASRPDVIVKEISCGHWPHQEKPYTFNDILIDFLRN